MDDPELDEDERRNEIGKETPSTEADDVGSNGVACAVAGQLVDGRVVHVGPKDVSVDLGSGHQGLLQVPAEFLGEFQEGDEVKGMLVDSVDPQGKLILSIEDPLSAEEPEDVASAAPELQTAENLAPHGGQVAQAEAAGV